MPDRPDRPDLLVANVRVWPREPGGDVVGWRGGRPRGCDGGPSWRKGRPSGTMYG